MLKPPHELDLLVNFVVSDSRVLDYRLIGSQGIPGAVYPDSDYDYLLLIKRFSLNGFKKKLRTKFVQESDGYGPYSPESKFVSFRSGKLNILITKDKKYYRNTIAAQEISEKLELVNRNDRVMVFETLKNLI